MKKNDHLFLLDGSGFIFRAYHALPKLTRKKDGLPVGAVTGFCNMLWKLLREARATNLGASPTHFAVIFDHSSDTFRKKIYPLYKANRQEAPEDLKPQFSLIRKACAAFNIICIEKPNFEADDLIATYTRLALEQEAKVTIISSDKDLMQLVTEDVCLFDPIKENMICRQEVIEKWGVPPELMPSLQALTGDSSDNIPGVPGIGKKTAAELLQIYENLDNLLAQLNKIKQPKRRESLISHKEQIYLALELVKLKNNVNIDISLDDLILQEQDAPKIIGFLKALELKSLANRISQHSLAEIENIEPSFIEVEWKNPSDAVEETEPPLTKGGEGGGAALFYQSLQKTFFESPLLAEQYLFIKDIEELKNWLNYAQEQYFCSVETEFLDNKLSAISLSLSGEKTAFACFSHQEHQQDENLSEKKLIDFSQAYPLLKIFFENKTILKILHDAKQSYLMLQKKYNIKMQAYDDVQLMSYVFSGNTIQHDVESLAQYWLGLKLNFDDKGKDKSKSETNALPYWRLWSQKANCILNLWKILKPALISKGLLTVYETLERPLIAVLVQMELLGIKIDKGLLNHLSEDFSKSLSVLEQEIYKEAGEEFNIGSPKQLGEILFKKLNFTKGKKTKTGQFSTSAKILENFSEEGYKLPQLILEWRQLSKLKATYTDSLVQYLDNNNRVHTSFRLASTSTGRLASFDPNLQNIPTRTEEGKKIRGAFIAEEDHFLLCGDYNQIELRLLAHVGDVKELKESFRQNYDVHTLTAAKVFNISATAVTPDIRRRAKAINFGIIYGISSFGLANQLSISRQEAKNYIEDYFKRFPAILGYMEETKAFARDKGYVCTIFGRKIYFPEIKAKNAQLRAFNERAAINARLQGSAADIIRRAMVKIPAACAKQNMPCKMLLQVHDELIFEVAEKDLNVMKTVVKETMEDAVFPALNLSVPLDVTIGIAKNWREAH